MTPRNDSDSLDASFTSSTQNKKPMYSLTKASQHWIIKTTTSPTNVFKVSPPWLVRNTSSEFDITDSSHQWMIENITSNENITIDSEQWMAQDTSAYFNITETSQPLMIENITSLGNLLEVSQSWMPQNTTSSFSVTEASQPWTSIVLFGISLSLLIAGILGNSLTVVVLTKTQFKTTSHGVYISTGNS